MYYDFFDIDRFRVQSGGGIIKVQLPHTIYPR